MKSFKVGVFPLGENARQRFIAYTTWYNPAWRGCCVHEVFVESKDGGLTYGETAKKRAILEHKAKCLEPQP